MKAIMPDLQLKKVLIIQTASIGDVILSTPLLEQLHQSFPMAQIDLLIKQGNDGLFENHPFLNTLWIWEKNRHKYKNLFKLWRKIRKSHYDMIINVQRFASTGFLTAFGGASISVGFSKNPLSFLFTKKIKHRIGSNMPPLHETERNHALIEWLSGGTSPKPALYPGTVDRARVSALKTRAYICIAPASLWFTKQFPTKKWIEFVKEVPTSYNVYLLGSKADHGLCETIVNTAEHPSCLNLAGRLSLLESAALMADARMNFVNDSAPMHLASSVNAPTTAIFCSTVPEFGFGPLSDNAILIQSEQKLNCRPCGLHGKKDCPEGHFDCANTISIQQLLERI